VCAASQVFAGGGTDVEKYGVAVEARLEFMGLVSNGEKSVAFMGSGIQADRQQCLRQHLHRFHGLRCQRIEP
jgi:hypothetical protein